MPCHVKYGNHNEHITCQFQTNYKIFSDEDLFKFDKKQWCLFHMPVQDAYGNKSIKFYTPEKISDQFFDCLKKVFASSNENLDFSCVIFPPNEPIDFHKYLSNNSSGLNFKKCQFWSNCLIPIECNRIQGEIFQVI